jgi:hypothetical protein
LFISDEVWKIGVPPVSADRASSASKQLRGGELEARQPSPGWKPNFHAADSDLVIAFH